MNKSYSLFIDTTQNYCNLAILDDQNLIVNKLQILTHNNMTDVVVEKISELLNSTNVDKKDIKNIYLLIEEMDFNFKDIDTIALNIGIDEIDDRRIQALIIYL